MSNSGQTLPKTHPEILEGEGVLSPSEPSEYHPLEEKLVTSPTSDPSSTSVSSPSVKPKFLPKNEDTTSGSDGRDSKSDGAESEKSSTESPVQVEYPIKRCYDLRPPPFGKEKIHLSRDDAFAPDLPCSKSQMFEDEGGGDGLALVGSDDEDSPPSFDTLQDLLANEEARKLFVGFISMEENRILDFYFACNGFKNENEEHKMILIPIIFKRYKSILRNFITDGTYRKIDKRSREVENLLQSMKNEFNIDKIEDIDEEILRTRLPSFISKTFNQAKVEVEKKLTDTAFKRFQTSERFAKWLCQPRQSDFLPTLHEEREFVPSSSDQSASLLTTGNLLATARQRANLERFKNNMIERTLGPHPYHTAYAPGVLVSLQDSERQSLSSGAHTDTLSCTSGSMDGLNYDQPYSRKYLRFQQKNAKLNPEEPLFAAAVQTTCVVPRTKIVKPDPPLAEKDADAFYKLLTEKLLTLKQKENAEESFQKIINSDDTSSELQREHAENSLPPKLLASKLSETACRDESIQQILDDHVARVFHSPDHTPASPKPKSPPNKVTSKPPKFRQFPHLGVPSNPNHPLVAAHSSKGTTKLGKYIPSSYLASPTTATPVAYQQQQPMINVVRSPYHSTELYSSQQHKFRNHGRRRDRGQDVYSTFSADSGNVSEYTSLPKSKSMPEYMENHGGISDGGSSNSRPGSGSRHGQRIPTELQEDSGVSMVSGSVPSLGSACLSADRRSIGNSGRRSQSSSSMSGMTCPQYHGEMTSRQHCDQFRDSPISQYYQAYERRKNRPMKPSNYSEGSHSNGSTMKKQQKLKQYEGSCMGIPGSGGVQIQGPPPSFQCNPNSTAGINVPPQPEYVVAVYNYADDDVPFTTKIPSRYVTLKKFKQHLPKKGNYRFFFKKFCEDIGVCMEEITDDTEYLPLFDGKIFAQIRLDD